MLGGLIRDINMVLDYKILDKFGFNENLSNILFIFINYLIYYLILKNLNYI